MMILTNTNYLDFDRQELLKIGFSSEQINSVVYGDQKQVRLKESLK